MYRVGDFFESFFEDAALLSAVCDLALTSKEAGKALGARVPMAGLPHYAIDDKIKMLLHHRVTVAVVDQVQSAAETAAGSLVKRAVTRLITPATAADDHLLDAKRSSYLATVVVQGPAGSGEKREGEVFEEWYLNGMRFGFSYADVSTGEFRVTDGEGINTLQRVLATVVPAELLLVSNPKLKWLRDKFSNESEFRGSAIVTHRDPHDLATAEGILNSFYAVQNVESLGCRGRPLCIQAAASLLSYTQQTLQVDSEQERPLPLNPLKTFALDDVMLLDATCLQNMEVVRTARDGDRERTLQWAVDRTVTVMGARCLRTWLLAPSTRLDVIQRRQNFVAAFLHDLRNRRTLVQAELKKVGDIERLGGKVGAGRASPRDLRWLCESILRVPAILKMTKACLQENPVANQNHFSIEPLTEAVDTQLFHLAEKISLGLVDPAPSSTPSEMMIRAVAFQKDKLSLASMRIFRAGYSEDLDNLRKAMEEPERWITVLEEQEQKRSGIDSLRIKHIKNAGYVLRIPRSVGERTMDKDPLFFQKLRYECVQSTKAELRFRFEELKTRESLHNSDLSEILSLEALLFNELRNKLAEHVPRLRVIARHIASIDVLAGFAQVAEELNYVMPQMLDKEERILHLDDARHPVVEQTLPVDKTFVPNSFQLGAKKGRSCPDLMLLCGPNAAGKSCALRSVGLICILGQTGCFVPARSAKISICDRIFTRVGAVDDIARGQSTFQVEMAETASILAQLTSSSLVLLDEIGRGTSAVDGISIAWSVSEHLAKGCVTEGRASSAPKSIFVTHYHELNQLASLHPNIHSFRLEVAKRNLSKNDGNRDRVEWIATHRIIPGASFESHGLAVARRAGFPREVLERAEEIAKLLKAPSHALGAELRKALSESSNSNNCGATHVVAGDDENDEKETETEMTNALEQGVSMYQKGFEDGYESAKAELYADIQKAIVNLQPRLDVRD